MTENIATNESCRHCMLGSGSTLAAGVSKDNICQRAEPPERVDLSHQESFCLSPEHTECPLNQPGWSGPLPDDLKPIAMIGGLRVKHALLLGSVSVVLLIGLGFLLGKRAQAARTPVPGPTPTQIATQAILGEPTREAVEDVLPASETPTMTITPTETPYPTPTKGPGLETPISAELPYLIHKIEAGESIPYLESTFDTSGIAMKASNLIDGWPFEVGQRVVIPVGITSAEGLVRFDVIMVSERRETIESFAERHGTDPSQLIRYNNLGEDPNLPRGRWLIVPIP